MKSYKSEDLPPIDFTSALPPRNPEPTFPTVKTPDGQSVGHYPPKSKTMLPIILELFFDFVAAGLIAGIVRMFAQVVSIRTFDGNGAGLLSLAIFILLVWRTFRNRAQAASGQ